MIYTILGMIISGLLTYLFFPKLKLMISNSNLTCNNYKNNKIPNSMGLTFIFSQTLTLGILKLFFGIDDSLIGLFLLGFIFIGLLGLLDDTIGNDKYKGLKGHIGAFLNGELTTGNIKALMGGFISLYISSYLDKSLLSIFINGILMALFINFMNLFDLRPGRAGKVFLFIMAIMSIISIKSPHNFIFLALMASVIVYLPNDLNAKVMMGDTGSNILGYSLGFYFIIHFNLISKCLGIIVLIVIHYIAEKISFSDLIRNNKVLNYIDMLGR